jgi:AcrR family transcriptional regulator
MTTGEELLDAATLTANVVGATSIATALEGAGIVLRVVNKHFPNGTGRFNAAVEQEVRDAVFTVVPDLEKRIVALESNLGTKPSIGATSAILEGFAEAYVKAEDAKREILLNALRNAFDPDLYKKGMTVRLFELMDHLDYPDLSQLVVWQNADGLTPWRDASSPDAYHATRLVDAGLLDRRPLGPRSEPHDAIARVTFLGRLMNDLIRSVPAVG